MVHHSWYIECTNKEGPYYCKTCKLEVDECRLQNITMDNKVLHWVIMGACRAGTLASESTRIERAADWLHWDGARLFCHSHDILLCIPAVGECKELFEEAVR